MPDEYGNPTEEDWVQMIFGGMVQPGVNPQYSKDELSGVKSQQTMLNQLPNVLGFDPIEQYGGPEFEPYTAMSDILLQELPQDFTGNAIRASIEAGEGTLTIRQRLAALRDKGLESPDGKEGISEEEFEAYADWLDKFQAANARDQIEFSNRQLQETEGDPFGQIPLNPTPDEYVQGVQDRGDFDLYGGQEDTAQSYLLKQQGRRVGNNRIVGPEGLVEDTEENREWIPDPLGGGKFAPSDREGEVSRGSKRYYERRGARAKERAKRRPAFERAQGRASETLRREAERQQGATRPSAANQRARANIRMYRMFMGLPAE